MRDTHLDSPNGGTRDTTQSRQGRTRLDDLVLEVEAGKNTRMEGDARTESQRGTGRVRAC